MLNHKTLLFSPAALLAVSACFLGAAPSLAKTQVEFPNSINSALPYDVDIDALRKLSTTPNKSKPPFTLPDENIPEGQRLFDIFAWQSFLALNWPALDNGTPNNSLTLTDTRAPRVWEYFVDIGQVFRKDGTAPIKWSDASKASLKKDFWMHGMGLGTPKDKKNGEGGYRSPVLDESLQAFTGPMVDQDGKWVRYQAAMNKTEFDYVVQNQLYNLEGQIAYNAENQIKFPANKKNKKHGSMEIKMSWKQMSDTDATERFFIREARVIPLTGKPYKAKFGLVGMHIAVRTQSSPTWIWATFEQVDNTSANTLKKDKNGRRLKPTFFNNINPSIPVNMLAPKNAAPVNQYNLATGKDDGPAVFTSWDETLTTDPTQTLMVLPIPKITAALNTEVQATLAEMDSVFQYYELIGTQWPTAPSFPSFSNGVANQPDGRILPSSHESIVFKVPGKVVPVNLINTTMETFFQNGNQPAGPVALDYRLPAGLLADPNTIFATESCAGCHFSAGAAVAFKTDPYGRFVTQTIDGKKYRVPIFGQNAVNGLTGDADYSWLLQLRAQSAPYTGSDTVDISTVLIPNTQHPNN